MGSHPWFLFMGVFLGKMLNISCPLEFQGHIYNSHSIPRTPKGCINNNHLVFKPQTTNIQYPFNPWNSSGHIYNTHLVLGTPKDAYVVPIQSLEFQRKLVKQSYDNCIVITFPIEFLLYFFTFYYLFAFSISPLSTCIWYTSNIILYSYFFNKIFFSSNPILLIYVLNCLTQYLHFN